jgi:hypothetical protein
MEVEREAAVQRIRPVRLRNGSECLIMRYQTPPAGKDEFTIRLSTMGKQSLFEIFPHWSAAGNPKAESRPASFYTVRVLETLKDWRTV